MSINKLISIIIPAYNAEKTIERCIISIKNQDYDNIEIIVIDDGSTDSTKNILENLKKEIKNLKVYIKKNEGVSIARNLGIEKSNGEFIIFVDSDDYINANMCSTLVKNMNDNVDMVICGFKEIKNKEFICNEIPDDRLLDKYFKISDIFNEIYYSKLLNQPWNKIFRKDKIVKKFNEKKVNGEDIEFVLEYLKNDRNFTFCNEVLYVNDTSNENSLSRNYLIVFDSIISYHNYILGYLKENFDENYYSNINDNFIRDIIFKSLNFMSTGSNKNYELLYDKINNLSMRTHIKELLPKSRKCKVYKSILLCKNKYLFILSLNLLIRYRNRKKV